MDEPKTGGDRPTVLVVDDDSETADRYTKFLAEEYTVLTAYSGEAALEVVSPEVDVVLLDRRMPGISGEDVLKTIRERSIDCRIVMVTGVDPDVDILDLPFDDYLVKPVTRERIHDAVSRMLVRDACDETIRETVALVSKMATLESKMTIQEMEASEEYAALREQLSELRKRNDIGSPEDDVYTEFATEKLQELFN